jgi:hypothetical protein
MEHDIYSGFWPNVEPTAMACPMPLNHLLIFPCNRIFSSVALAFKSLHKGNRVDCRGRFYGLPLYLGLKSKK